MISYAQNAEDVVLARLFRDQASGRYIDVGAGHPTDDSVTRHFYDLGWQGINIEPMAREHEMLCRERPRDVNLAVALSDHVGRATLYEAPLENRGASTLLAEVARSYRGQTFRPTTVEVTTLADVGRDHPVDDVEFLKIDVEGHEASVLRGADWDRLRPRVLVVEATEPNSRKPSHDAWEPIVLEAGYRCALFDGLHRFYAQVDDAQALEVLAVPANVFDDYAPWRWARQLEGAREHIANVEAGRATAEEWAALLDREIRALAGEARSLPGAPSSGA